ncbi:MAG: hypothetical protein V3V81_04780 [Candidatus Bathyarchaeia archaeon]
MKSYPTISYDVITTIPIYAFDKLDGSNIRAEWSRKKGFWKFGTRKRLLDKHDLMLGDAPILVKEKYEEDLSKIFYDNKWGRVLCFFEYHGENSFAGNHEEDEEQTVTLIDINPFKKGILSAPQFIKLTEKVDIPNVLYYGRVRSDFINKVRNSLLPGLTFEGVVCKGVKGREIKMFKIKSRVWIEAVKEKFQDNGNKLNELLDRVENSLDDSVPDDYRQRSFCPNCFVAGRLGNLCYKCGAQSLPMSYDAQPPKMTASKTRWRSFFKQNYPKLDFGRIWKTRKRN